MSSAEKLRKAAERADLRDVDGTPLRFTPHDFRRVFATEAVNGGPDFGSCVPHTSPQRRLRRKVGAANTTM
ncbi:hypothetical protein GCM10010102_34530 [Promicromonospora citrea]|uniref:Phage integrase family protein n=1 Tax=Promicromonospora citrea TaxID=43677 RepID=A0A8H9L6D9_9MICO|nr:hypothetical protein GCM10010102_34530 [Promicromonospora citrea]